MAAEQARSRHPSSTSLSVRRCLCAMRVAGGLRVHVPPPLTSAGLPGTCTATTQPATPSTCAAAQPTARSSSTSTTASWCSTAGTTCQPEHAQMRAPVRALHVRPRFTCISDPQRHAPRARAQEAAGRHGARVSDQQARAVPRQLSFRRAGRRWRSGGWRRRRWCATLQRSSWQALARPCHSHSKPEKHADCQLETRRRWRRWLGRGRPGTTCGWRAATRF